MLRQLKNNERGIVFVTVLLIIIVMIILTISVISMNVSQVMISESEVKRLQAEIIALGALSYTFANQLSESPGDYISYTESLDGITFNVEAVIDPSGTGIYGTNSLNIYVTY